MRMRGKHVALVTAMTAAALALAACSASPTPCDKYTETGEVGSGASLVHESVRIWPVGQGLEDVLQMPYDIRACAVTGATPAEIGEVWLNGEGKGPVFSVYAADKVEFAMPAAAKVAQVLDSTYGNTPAIPCVNNPQNPREGFCWGYGAEK